MFELYCSFSVLVCPFLSLVMFAFMAKKRIYFTVCNDANACTCLLWLCRLKLLLLLTTEWSPCQIYHIK